MIDQICQVIPDVEIRQAFGLAQSLVGERNGSDAVLRLVKHAPMVLVSCAPRLEAKQAAHHGKIVLDSVMNFP